MLEINFELKIKNKEPFVFVKFGDGELNCMKGEYGTNCDRDDYQSKSLSLIKAFEYLSCTKNVYIGKWHTIMDDSKNYVPYHSFIPDGDTIGKNKETILNRYKAIKESNLPKIFISNYLLARCVPLLNINTHIIVPLQNWYLNYQEYKKILENILSRDPYRGQAIIITCAGMASKILISDLHSQFPQNLYIDIGAGLDFLCTKHDSRGWPYNYEQLEQYFNCILPELVVWNNSKYDCLYEEAKKLTGIHLK